ncbi:hypothetical protein EYF80_040571 [Liparis tanakae]|uniref:Secreted protein n=1 Tax=Liparis tanakae TaxID=230148 RepID=A0A4Z2G831_9TELE|nr:hypothetical protein EYF80_040571 [Liparis tanakae]
MRHRLSRLLAAATSVLTLLSPPSNWARLWRRDMMAVTAFWTNETSCWESMFSGWPAGDSGMDVSSCVFLCHAMISSRSTAFRMPSTWRHNGDGTRVHGRRALSNERAAADFLSGSKCCTEPGEVSGSFRLTTNRCVLTTELSTSFARDRQLTPASHFEMHSSLKLRRRHLGHGERVQSFTKTWGTSERRTLRRSCRRDGDGHAGEPELLTIREE